MCFLKLNNINIDAYAKEVIDNTNLMINTLKAENVKTINDIAQNHIILVDLTTNELSGKMRKNFYLIMEYL